MDRLSFMSVFRRVAETGSFTAVAQETGLSQPTVSKQVAALEKYLNCKLISRSTRQLTLTESGKDYYERCVRILDEISETEASISQQQVQPSGTLRMHAPITFGRMHILPLIWHFLDRNPELHIDLTLDDHNVDMVKEGVDLAIRIGPLVDSSLIARKIGDCPRVTISSPDYLAKYGEPTSPDQLNRHDCIVFTLLSTREQWHFNGPNGKEVIQVAGQFCSNSPDAIREAVINHRGIAVMPYWIISDCILDGRVKAILNDYTPTPLDLHALYPARRFVPAKARLLIDYLSKHLMLDTPH